MRPNFHRTVHDARELREAFVDRPVRRTIQIPWQWPKSMQEIGRCEAVMYASDKWQRRRGDKKDYKHVAEGPQWVLARRGFLVEYDSPHEPVPVTGPFVDLDQMPSSFAVLADILGVQLQLYQPMERNGYALGNGDDGLSQVNIARAKLGAARFPDSGDAFLIVYTPAGVDLLIVGEKLDVQKDGIVG